jgi:hypothetical protein
MCLAKASPGSKGTRIRALPSCLNSSYEMPVYKQFLTRMKCPFNDGFLIPCCCSSNIVPVAVEKHRVREVSQGNTAIICKQEKCKTQYTYLSFLQPNNKLATTPTTSNQHEEHGGLCALPKQVQAVRELVFERSQAA